MEREEKRRGRRRSHTNYFTCHSLTEDPNPTSTINQDECMNACFHSSSNKQVGGCACIARSATSQPPEASRGEQPPDDIVKIVNFPPQQTVYPPTSSRQ